MMLATVYYVEMSERQIADLNATSWKTRLGQAYWDCREGKHTDAIRLCMMKPAARMQASSAEQVWQALQNINEPWIENELIQCLTKRPRSMDVGDVVVWENGTAEYCADFGFKPLGTFEVEVADGKA